MFQLHQPTFEGQSSFHHQSLLAKDAVFTAVGSAQSSRLDDNVSAALSSLKDSLNRHPEPDSQRLPEPEFSREQLLPVDIVVAIVKRVKGMLYFLMYLAVRVHRCFTYHLYSSSWLDIVFGAYWMTDNN